MTVTVRIPVGAERKACRMLLPEVASDPRWTAFLLATTGSPAQVVGAVAHVPVIERDGTAGTRLAIRVVRPFRRRGLGRAIIEAVAAEVENRGPRLLVMFDPTAHPEATPFLTRCGFARVERESTFTADWAASRERLITPLRRLESRGAVPAGARIVPLAEAPLDELVALHVSLIGGTPEGMTAMLKTRRSATIREHSQVLLVDGRPLGLILGGTHGGVGTIEAKLVSPTLQTRGLARGWPDLMLMGEGIRSADQDAPTSLRFACRESNRPMMRLARHLNASVMRKADIFVRAAT